MKTKYICRQNIIHRKMGLIIFLIVTAVGIVGIVIAVMTYIRKQKKQKIERRAKTIESLCSYLLPGDKNGLQRKQLIGELQELTGCRFRDEEVLEYYLAIKGLQMVDLNTLNDPDTLAFLMEPTKIRLHYREVVSFYEKYLNQPQVKGMSAI